MQKNLPVIAIACLFSVPMFALPLDSGVGGACSCTCVQDPSFTSGSCSGDCDCTVTCDGITCVADCVCLGVEEEIEHDEELVFEDILENEQDIEDTGMMGTTEGTYADYEEVYIVDGETSITNEVDITPSWCE